ncbi:TraR/DksA C4-type zinc finger protein [Actinoplanes sp. DH11]|uniref:TraR/DksA family transcriptional regulator n=1 Tax=Actinoplanes sp. DH11 TaxID=2857011 RepID=UPI001E4D14AF|nr:TraR/DksA C4-type zinc finger protein [Actinoplanes sp. DH11]
MTAIVHDSAEADAGVFPQLLRDMLEERFAIHTNRLTELVVCEALPHHGGRDPRMLAASIAASRQAVADTAHALQRMSQGTYGRWQSCHRTIPWGRLRELPEADFCVPCQRTRSLRSVLPAHQ